MKLNLNDSLLFTVYIKERSFIPSSNLMYLLIPTSKLVLQSYSTREFHSNLNPIELLVDMDSLEIINDHKRTLFADEKTISKISTKDLNEVDCVKETLEKESKRKKEKYPSDSNKIISKDLLDDLILQLQNEKINSLIDKALDENDKSTFMKLTSNI